MVDPMLMEIGAKAVLYLIGGYVFGKLAGFFTRAFVKNVLGIDRWIEKRKLQKVVRTPISKTASFLITWYVYLAFTLAAFELFGENPMVEMLKKIFDYYPKLVGAIVIYLAGMLLAENMKKSLADRDVVAEIVYIGILGMFLLSAIQTMGINIQPLLLVIAILVGSFLATLGIALGIGLGLALRDVLHPYLKKWVKRWLGE